MIVDLRGRRALVTGAGRGLGRAIAAALAAAGADLVLTYHRSAAGAEEAAAAARARGRDATCAALDVSDAVAVEALFERLRGAGSGLDILVNNAGIVRDRLVAAMSVDDWDRVQAVDLRGAFLCTRAVLPLMLPAGRGKIVNVASVVALRGGRGQANYAAAKAGLVALTRATALELAGKGIQVNAVLPGVVATAMSERVRRAAGDALLAAIPSGRFTTPEDVAALVVFLASPHADAITGQAVAVDGGLSVA